MAGVFVVEIVLNRRLQRDGGRHLRVSVVEVCLRYIRLCPGRQDRGNQFIVRFDYITAAVQFDREFIADAVKRVPAEEAHQCGLAAVEIGLILRQLRTSRLNTRIGLHHV